ncbi:tRNA 2-selenouridine(34) synthase MnmH [Trinickia caryophylli]|uniref:tRNA 2-selenouridine synthase n=1 Tax=Trinickia caryophylli TaxID=28094 RepID=A0A1X7DNU4_TRICW|nr:tRNA 2-selenouridine(34) synthase MnmH [Trinickia caryophylli]PMS10614.1 tRNA 2-selenouridine(34) synthase MnmH [Trinickia caryophylli]TRX17210.1 tRNA 2-selenouridine(34) synthase MnmH [Trinickia caryophylli]WQE12056.1 tRNA 2-selenouridine(34) synthase MnmH [Trinickia caryophylli]SMF18831.1 tRNA 2-selenouridine synthase [Trinickia caryophylli]GLU31822.1 tRNA 2-selenouridine synthase [Trinickia caryophylli]
MKNLVVPIDALASFDEIIDVRTPLEFAEDHIPGAINAPVLSNEERVIVGTLYKASPFEASRVGAAMVARNIATHLDTLFADRPRGWRPLVYCWRGGKRSGSMTVVLGMIGWQARQLDGGYKAYRRSVLERLEQVPPRLSYIVLAGHTGSGKTRLLHALGGAGAQVLDLEGFARHRGSLLGGLPECGQPSQKAFDTALAAELARFRIDRPVFVEAESRRIGRVTVPAALLDAFRAGRCVQVAAPLSSRVAFLLEDYGHLFDAPERFKEQLARLIGLQSRQTVERWHAYIDANERERLSTELLELHYDPAYARSSERSFGGLDGALEFEFDPGDADIAGQARRLVALAEAKWGIEIAAADATATAANGTQRPSVAEAVAAER